MALNPDMQRLGFVIDGLNVAYAHGNHQHASVDGIALCVDYWMQNGARQLGIVVVLPQQLPFDTSALEGVRIIRPQTRERGDDDRVAIRHAIEHDA